MNSKHARPTPSRGRLVVRGALTILLSLFTALPNPLIAAEVADAEKLFRAGKYDDCAKTAADELTKPSAPSANAAWWLWKIRAEMVRGKTEDAGTSLATARQQYPNDLGLLLLGYELARTTGKDKEAAELEKLIRGQTARSPAEQVALGRFMLARGKDAKEVLDQYYTPTAKKNPEYLDTHLAIAELALGKNDRKLAADTLQKAPKDAAQDPQFHYLLGRAFVEDDRENSGKAIDKALSLNPNHVDSLLFQIDHLLNAEKYPETLSLINLITEIDPGEPRAWAYRAALAHLQVDAETEKKARETALSRWAGNPEVDHLIGRKLSQDYRFAEGSAYQRQALAKDKNYLPAKMQLCQDLLRLGEEAEGWKLAAEVFAADGYNIVAHNLVTLRDQLANYRTIASDGFLLRMEAKEADLYGQRALALLRRARKTLGEKYGVKLDQAVTVEIFPRKQDFAVRTFGMPGAEGFLGVCFGPVITVNSPASQGAEPSNWEAVLWHEFCHTVTLHKSRNKMPRWLSEGISVYEEMQENPSWGQRLTPQYREMINGDELTPMSQLTSAFMNAKSGLHIQFAYFESALAVEFLIQRHKLETLKSVLDDLGAGLTINESLERRTGTQLAKLDRDFAEFARARAKELAPEATWEKPELSEDADSTTIRAWVEKHPKNFWGLQRLGAQLVREKKWADAKKVLKEFQALDAQYIGTGNAYELLAGVHRQEKNATDEAAALEELAKLNSDAFAAFQRLAELGGERGDWALVAQNARRMLAVNPLLVAPHRTLAKAAEQLKEREEAVAAYHSVLQFAPPDAADVHYRLALLHEQAGERDKARREVLKALEDAPRSREAHQLLLKIAAASPEKKP
jgi:Flp pilus assembly protein TadD